METMKVKITQRPYYTLEANGKVVEVVERGRLQGVRELVEVSTGQVAMVMAEDESIFAELFRFDSDSRSVDAVLLKASPSIRKALQPEPVPTAAADEKATA